STRGNRAGLWSLDRVWRRAGLRISWIPQMKTNLASRTRRVALLAHDRMNLLDLAGPLQALATATRRFSAKGPALYETRVVSVDGGLVTTSAGLPIMTEPLSALDGIAIDTLIAPGGSKDDEMHAPPKLVAWIAK